MGKIGCEWEILSKNFSKSSLLVGLANILAIYSLGEQGMFVEPDRKSYS